MTMRHIAGRVPTHPEAFSLDSPGRRKRPREHDRDHLKFIRTLPCLVCGSRNTIQAAHIRAGNAVYAKRATGAGEKPSDQWCLPLCAAHHEEQHRGNEITFWRQHGIDPFRVAQSLYQLCGDEAAAELVIKLARPNGVKRC